MELNYNNNDLRRKNILLPSKAIRALGKMGYSHTVKTNGITGRYYSYLTQKVAR